MPAERTSFFNPPLQGEGRTAEGSPGWGRAEPLAQGPPPSSPLQGEVKRNTITEDAVLGGRLLLRQPRRGHRVGHDAILLAAACPARARERVVDLGAGVGAAGLALAQRVNDCSVTLVEIDPALAALAAENARANGLGGRVSAV